VARWEVLAGLAPPGRNRTRDREDIELGNQNRSAMRRAGVAVAMALYNYTLLPACQLPTGNSRCTSLSANSLIMLRSYTSCRPRRRVTKQEMAAVSGVGIGSGPGFEDREGHGGNKHQLRAQRRKGHCDAGGADSGGGDSAMGTNSA
jgi:hypothetical protein